MHKVDDSYFLLRFHWLLGSQLCSGHLKGQERQLTVTELLLYPRNWMQHISYMPCNNLKREKVFIISQHWRKNKPENNQLAHSHTPVNGKSQDPEISLIPKPCLFNHFLLSPRKVFLKVYFQNHLLEMATTLYLLCRNLWGWVQETKFSASTPDDFVTHLMFEKPLF